MTVQQDFLAFADAGGANVVSQAAYAAIGALGPGFATGIAPSNVCNKVWRQSSVIAYVVAQLIADVTGQNVLDNGSPGVIEQNFLNMLLLSQYQVDTGAGANTYSVVFTPAVTPYDGMCVRFRPTHTNTGASTFSVNGSTAHAILNEGLTDVGAGQLVAGGEVMLSWNVTLTSWCMLTANGSGGVSGQAWVDVTGSRTLAANYTNTTGRTIMVNCDSGDGGAVNGGCNAVVGGVTIYGSTGYTGYSSAHLTFLVPPGAVYQFNAQALYKWSEFR